MSSAYSVIFTVIAIRYFNFFLCCLFQLNSVATAVFKVQPLVHPVSRVRDALLLSLPLALSQRLFTHWEVWKVHTRTMLSLKQLLSSMRLRVCTGIQCTVDHSKWKRTHTVMATAHSMDKSVKLTSNGTHVSSEKSFPLTQPVLFSLASSTTI